MALSNIFREPQREITETVLGIVVVLPALAMAWKIADFLSTTQGAPPWVVCFGLSILITGIVIAISLAILVFIHFIGEEVCGALAERGLEIRPKDRR